MSGEWTVDTLKDHIERVIADYKETTDRRFAQSVDTAERGREAEQTALRKSEEALNRRLDLMNEFRSQILEERATFATLDRLDALDEKISTRIASVESWQSKIVGALGLIVFVVPLAVGLFTFILARHG